MASLMRPLLSRGLVMSLRKSTVTPAVVMRGLASQPPTKGPSDSLEKPIAKKAVDPTADPKESCKSHLNTLFYIFFLAC